MRRLKVIYQPRGRAGEYAKLAANLYSGCVNRCSYCYVPSVLHKDPDEFHSCALPRENVLFNLHSDCHYLAAHPERTERVWMCFTCDPYPPIEVHEEITRSAIRLLNDHGLWFEVCSKSVNRAARDFHLYKPGDWFCTSLTIIQPEQALIMEPGADSPSARIKALALAQEHGITTAVSMEPVLSPEQSLALIKLSAKYTYVYRLGMLNHSPYADQIDWADYLDKATSLLDSLGKSYVIKHDLQEAAGYAPTTIP